MMNEQNKKVSKINASIYGTQRESSILSPSFESEQEYAEFICATKSINLKGALEHYNGVCIIRRFLSKETSPPIQEVIESGIVPRLVKFLTSPNSFLQLESAWIITNVLSGTKEQTLRVIDAGAVPILINLLLSGSVEIKEQVIWALGNMVGDCPEIRDLVLQQGIMTPLLSILNCTNRQSTLCEGAWTLSNLCCGRTSRCDWKLISPALPTLVHMLQNDSEAILVNVCWCLIYMTENTNDKIQKVVESNVCIRLVQLLTHPSGDVQMTALRCLGNIVTGDDAQTDTVPEQCAQKGNLLDDFKHHCGYCILDDFHKRSRARFLVSEGIIEHFVNLLESNEEKLVEVVLDGLEQILMAGEKIKNESKNRYAYSIEAYGGMESIEKLTRHEQAEINQRARKLIHRFFEQKSYIYSEAVVPQRFNVSKRKYYI
ncbi:unnamed protein product [Rhizopus stolonifer]